MGSPRSIKLSGSQPLIKPYSSDKEKTTKTDEQTQVTNLPYKGAFYSGTLNKEGHPDGEGVITFPSKNSAVQRYQGKFKDGVPEDNGNGYLVLKNKNIISQAVLTNGKLVNGVHSFERSDGTILLNGQFMLDHEANPFTILDKDWRPGIALSLPLVIANHEGIYSGPINANWQPNGDGKFFVRDDRYSRYKEFIGVFNEGNLKHGKVKYTDSTTRRVTNEYNGSLVNLLHHGSGSLVSRTTHPFYDIEQNGTFVKGKFISGQYKTFLQGQLTESHTGPIVNELIHGLGTRTQYLSDCIIVSKLSFDNGIMQNGNWSETFTNLNGKVICEKKGIFKNKKLVEGTVTEFDPITGEIEVVTKGEYDANGNLQTGEKTRMVKMDDTKKLCQRLYDGTFKDGELQAGTLEIVDADKQIQGYSKGKFKNDKLDGEGSYEYHDQLKQEKIKCTGNFIQGLLNGKGIYQIFTPNKTITLEGDFENGQLIKGTKIEEPSKIYLPTQIHSGNFKEGQLIGRGTYTYKYMGMPMGDQEQKLLSLGKIEGIWDENGVTDAIHTVDDQYTYHGNLTLHEDYHGIGIIKIGNNEFKAIFDNGELVNNEVELTSPVGYYKGTGIFDNTCLPHPKLSITGSGVYDYKEIKVKHKGGFRDGLPWGDGTRYLPNGDYYSGMFEGNKVSNLRYHFANGDYFDQNNADASLSFNPSFTLDELDKQIFTAYGDLVFVNGCRYAGSLKDGKPAGRGEIYFPDGTYYQVEYAHGNLAWVKNTEDYLQSLGQVNQIDALALPLAKHQINNMTNKPAKDALPDAKLMTTDKDIPMHQLNQSYSLLLSIQKSVKEYADLNYLKSSHDLAALEKLPEKCDSHLARLIEEELQLSKLKNNSPNLQSKVSRLQTKILALKEQLKELIIATKLTIKQIEAARKLASGKQFTLRKPNDKFYRSRLVIKQKLWEQLPEKIQTLLESLDGTLPVRDYGNPQFKLLPNDTAEIKFLQQEYGDLRIFCKLDPIQKCYVALKVGDHDDVSGSIYGKSKLSVSEKVQ